MFLTGLGIPVFATLNGGLGRGLDHPVAATVITFAVGLTLSLVILAIVGPPPLNRFAAIPTHNYLGVTFMLFYILAVTYFAPRMGLGNAIFFVLLGQLIAAAVIDHYALLGASRFTLTPKRALGIVIMALGVYLARKPR